MKEITCNHSGITIQILKTNGGKGRINKIDIYDSSNNHIFTHHICLHGLQIDSYKKVGNNFEKC